MTIPLRLTTSSGGVGVTSGAPPLPPAADVLLEHYFTPERRAYLPDRPSPGWEELAAAVLAPSGSAPGADDEPYEVYHLGVRFVSCLLGQAIYASEEGDDVLLAALGPSVDLLVWILKYIGAQEAAGMRPLQLPTCFRRLFGSILVVWLTPEIEPHLCGDQAARRGGALRGQHYPGLPPPFLERSGCHPPAQ